MQENGQATHASIKYGKSGVYHQQLCSPSIPEKCGKLNVFVLERSSEVEPSGLVQYTGIA